MRKLFVVILSCQLLLGVIMVTLLFLSVISDDFFVDYYLVLYRPTLDFFVRGSPFMGLLFALPVLMSIYSLVLAGIFAIFRDIKTKLKTR